MTTPQIITSIFEFLVLAGIVIGFIYENKIAALEKKFLKKWRVKK